MSDNLGDRMKEYELRDRSYLQRRAYTVIRVDGKAFHTYTKGLDKPFDVGLVGDMANTTKYLCENIQGCKVGYTQSDEISLVLTDFDKIGTDAFFGGQVQKVCSVVASMATARFNQLRLLRAAFDDEFAPNPTQVINVDELPQLAVFDARCFSVSSQDEAINYLRWRQQDAVKNSISMVAQSLYSHKELHKKNGSEKQEMIFQKGQNWNNYPESQKRGSTIVKTYVKTTNPKFKALEDKLDVLEFYERTKWDVQTPDYRGEDGFAYLSDVIPKL